jgi:hypothetical protein
MARFKKPFKNYLLHSKTLNNSQIVSKIVKTITGTYAINNLMFFSNNLASENNIIIDVVGQNNWN